MKFKKEKLKDEIDKFGMELQQKINIEVNNGIRSNIERKTKTA